MSPLEQTKRSRGALLAALRDVGAVVTRDLGHIRCPWHQDRTGSLSVYEFAGVQRWKCHTCDVGGTICDLIAIKDRKGLSEAARETIRRYGGLARTDAVADATPQNKPENQRAFPNEHAATSFLHYIIGGRIVRQDTYKDASNSPIMTVLRFDQEGKDKTFRPIHRDGEVWRIGDPPGLLPLFHLQHLAKRPDEPVYVVEGEKAAVALLQIGALSTTSAHGARSASRSDWTPLAGRTVMIWPDLDIPGIEYAEAVFEILLRIQPRPTVSLLDPTRLSVPLPPGGDAADFVQHVTGEFTR